MVETNFKKELEEVMHALKTVFFQEGLPSQISSDRDPEFISEYSQLFLKEMNVKQIMSGAYHPESLRSHKVW